MARERDSSERVRSGGLIGIKPPDVSPSEEFPVVDRFPVVDPTAVQTALITYPQQGSAKKCEDRLSRSLRFIRRPKPEQKFVTVDVNGEI